MAIPQQTGYFDQDSGRFLPTDTATWADWTSWASIGSWITAPQDEIIYVVPRIDLGREGVFNLAINTRGEGEISYRVYTSSTGAFDGEETETVIDFDDTDVPAFSGRYVIVAVYVQNQGGVQSIEDVEVRASTQTFTISRSEVDTTTLAGTTSSRTIDLGRTVGGIQSVSITGRTTEYTQDVYVTDYPTSTLAIPVTLNKNRTGPQFKLVGLDNKERDGTIDWSVEAVPEQTMVNGNLQIR